MKTDDKYGLAILSQVYQAAASYYYASEKRMTAEECARMAWDIWDQVELRYDRRNQTPWHNRPIYDLEVNTRAYSCLRWAGIHTVGPLLELSEMELLKLKNLGRHTADLIIQALKKEGLKLRGYQDGGP